MKPDIPIIGQLWATNKLLSFGLFRQEAERIAENVASIDRRRKIHELRKSCGVEDQPQSTIVVRMSPRYLRDVCPSQSEK